MQSTLATRTKLIDLELRQYFEAAFRPDLRVYGLCAGHGTLDQGLISIGVSLVVISQMSIISEFDTAMQPFVQSRVR